MLLSEVLADYAGLPEYSGVKLVDVNQVSLFGDRPINIAATRGSIAELQALFLAGADINSPGEHGYTPLHNATEQGALDAVKWLIENGADRGARNDLGWTALDLATALGEVGLYELVS
ncbi:ankyrin repeat domain-containing protein [Stenotrophomonas sp.]|uniref:ankyrin repeat domain-containing protein n=1 Tax=Stenotrophomonas sp. TaxID=69392 RepID=UPI0028A1C6ED|nr:ankyrin repeat domain-containing protein [Stenotrophomonas sp.]